MNKGILSNRNRPATADVNAPADEVSAIALQDRLNELGATDPEKMPAFLDTLPAGSFKVTAVLQSLETLASGEHPDHLLAGILTQVEADVLPQAWIAVGVGKARRNPHEAMVWAMTLPDPTVSDSCALQVAQQWGTTDPAAALQWLDQAETGPNWDELLQVIAASWASAQPDQAMRWAQEQAAADPDSSSITSIVERVVAERSEP